MTLRARIESVLGEKLARRFLGTAGVALSLRVAWAVANYVSIVLLARWMLPEAYGKFALVLGIMRPAALLAGLGAETGLIRFLGQYQGQGQMGLARGVMAYALRWVTLASVAVYAVLIAGFWAVALYSGLPAPWVYTVGLLLIPLYTIAGAQSAIARSFGHIVVALFPRDVLWRTALIPIGLLAVTYLEAGQQALVLVAGAVILLATLVAGQQLWLRIVLPRDIHTSPVERDDPEWRRVAWPIWIMAVGVGAITNLDIVVVGALTDEGTAGRYFAVQRTATLVTFMQASANMIVGPEIARLYHAGEYRSLQRILQLAAIMVFLPSMTAFVAFVFFGSWILGFFGPDFPAYHTELILLSLGMAISAAVGCVGLLLALSGHERFLSKVQLSTTFAALGIVIAGTWYAGTLGAAAGTMIGMSVRNLILWVYARRNLEVEASVLSLFKFARKKR